MKTITIAIDRSAVLDEVAKTTAYIGGMGISEEAPNAYEKVSTTDENDEMLNRFWGEACSLVVTELQERLTGVTMQEIDTNSGLTLELTMPEQYSDAMTESVRYSLWSCLVQTVVAKWTQMLGMEASGTYAAGATAMLTDAVRKLLYKQPPTMVEPT